MAKTLMLYKTMSSHCNGAGDRDSWYQKKDVSSGAGVADREVLLMLTRGSGLCVIGLGSILSLLYTFVIHIFAITVCFLYNFFSSKLFLSQPLMFAFCVPSNPIQPPAREEKQVSSM